MPQLLQKTNAINLWLLFTSNRQAYAYVVLKQDVWV